MPWLDEEPDDFHADDFGNDDAPLQALIAEPWAEWWEDPDDFFADDFGNDDVVKPKPPSGLTLVLH